MLSRQYILAKWQHVLYVLVGFCGVGLLFAALSAPTVYASERDSLRQVLLKNTLNDTDRAIVLERLVCLYMEAKPDSAIFYALQIQIIAERNIANKHLMVIALNALVNGYIHYDKPDKMLKYGFQLLHLSEELRDSTYLARASYAIGHASGQLFTKNDIKENTSALQYLRQALAVAERRHDTVLMAQSYNAIGRLYRKEEQFDSAMVYHNQALALANTVKLPVQQGWALHSLALCYENKGNLTTALQYALEGLSYREQVGNGIVTGFSLAHVTHLYQKSGNLRQALFYANRGLELAKTAEFRTAQYQAYERIAQIQEALGNYREALFYQRRFATVRDSVAILERTEDLRSLQAELKLEHSERERTLLVKEQEAQGLVLQREQILVVVMALGFILLVIIALVLLRVQRKQNFQSQEITKLKRILDESSDYVMMSEIASGKVLYMNKAYLSLINAQTPPKTLSELLHRVYEPATAETVLNTHLPLAIKHERLSGETSLLDHHGTQISVLHTTICHYDEQGEAVLVSSVMRDISERKRTEDALRESEELANSIINNLPIGLAMYDANGVLQRMNDELVKILQLPSSTYGLHVYNILEDSFAQEHLGSAVRRALGGEIIRQEVWRDYEGNKDWNTRKDKRCLDEVIFPIKDGNGNVTSFVLLVSDITERKQAENDLRESEQRFRTLFSSMDDIIFELDALERRFTNAWCADPTLLFMPPKEFLGKTIAEALGDEFASLINPVIEKAMKSGRAQRIEYETPKTVHQSRQWFEAKVVFLDQDERQAAMLAIRVSDISDRKKAEEEILANNRFIRTVTDSLPGMLAYWTVDLRCSFANSACLEWFGKTHEEMIGIGMYELLGVELFQNNERYIRAVLEGKPQHFERELVKANGEIRYTLAHYIPDIANGRVLGFIALVTDITIVKKAQNSLNEAQHLARIGSWEWDIASNTTIWSDEQYRLFGENRNSYQPTLEGYYSHLTREEQQKTATLVQKTLAGTAEYSIEHEITRPDGTVLFVLEQGTVIYDKNHKPLRMVGTTQDITERKRMEDELRKLSMVASKTTNAVVMTDINGYATWVNEGFTSLTEYSFAEALGKKPGQLLQGAKTDPMTLETMRAALQQGKGFDVEILNYTKSKKPYWVHINADPIFDDNRVRSGYIAIQTDITERKKAEEQQLQKLSMVASKTTNAVVITDAEYRITWVNEGYTRLTEYSLDEVRGEEPECSAQQSLIDQMTIERMRRAVTERISFEGEVMNYSKGGRLYWVHIKTDPFFDDDGTLAGFVSMKTDITERKQAEQLLKDSEERYRLIFENSNEGLIQTHPDGRIETVNSAACNIFGRSKEELSQMSRANIVDMNDPRLPAILEERSNVGYVKGELNFVRGDGTIFPGEFSSSIYVDSKGGQHIIVFLRDVSERKHAEKALRQSEGNLRALFESSIQAYYLIDKNYTVLSFNNVARDFVKSYFGRTLAVGDSILNYPIPDTFIEYFQRALQGEWIADERVALFPNNQRKFFEVLYSPVYDDKNEFIGVAYNMLDITERKELQTQVNEYSTRLQSIIVSMMDGVLLLNDQRTISLTNPAAEAIFGYAGEELFSQPLTLLLPDGILDLHEQHIESFLHNSPPSAPRHKSHIVQGRHKSGHLFPMEASIAHFTVEGRLFLLAVVRDITRRLETENEILELNRTLTQRVEERTAQLVKLNQEKDEFLGIAAHDLKNPLAAIRSSAQIIEECFASGERINFAEYADSIIAISDEMLDIITNFLDIELIENGKLGLALERVPHTIVDKAVKSHQRRARAKDITIHYEEPPVPISIIADKLAFRQVLDNLLSNAVKFSPRSKHIYVRLLERQPLKEQNTTFDMQDRYVRIEIQDEGPGVREDEQQKLFTKFTRLSAKPTGEEGSTGLGLSIVKKLVEMMNGRVWCESVKGEGARFIVELPIL